MKLERKKAFDDIPAKKQDAIEATKKAIEILQGAAGLVGVPLVKEVLIIGLAMVNTCEVGINPIVVAAG